MYKLEKKILWQEGERKKRNKKGSAIMALIVDRTLPYSNER